MSFPEQIVGQPLSRRKVPEYDSDDIRELIEKPYRIIYRIKPDQIDVIAVIHGARLFPEIFKKNGLRCNHSPKYHHMMKCPGCV